MAPETNRADRVLVWLVLAGLVFGGLATTAVAFTAEGVLASLSAADANDHGAASDMAHEAATEVHQDEPAGHTDVGQGDATAMPVTTALPSGNNGMAMPMATATETGSEPGPGHGGSPMP